VRRVVFTGKDEVLCPYETACRSRPGKSKREDDKERVPTSLRGMEPDFELDGRGVAVVNVNVAPSLVAVRARSLNLELVKPTIDSTRLTRWTCVARSPSLLLYIS